MADVNADDEVVGNFCSITGSTPEQARFYLDSAAGDLSAAMDSFYEAGRGDADDEDMGDEDMPVAAPLPAATSQPVAPRTRGGGNKSKPQGNVRSLADLAGDSDSDDSDGPNEYYTGGQKSGMMVQDPHKGKKNNAERVEALFEKARASGASTAESSVPPAAAGRPAAFQGRANTLSGSGPSGASAADEPAAPAQEEGTTQMVHTVTFYNNGFTVDDGPLRQQEDPANAPFLASIEKGELPKELDPGPRYKLMDVHVNLVRKEEDFRPPTPPKYIAFAGGGRTLGASSAGDAAAATAPPPPANPAAGGELVIDATQPVTSLQLRLHDGTRLVAKFNHSHTVGDIRQFINSSRPDMRATPFHLVTAFPASTLTDASASIADAGLVGAVVIQKL